MKQIGGILAFIGAVFLFVSFREGVGYMLPHVDLYAEETNVSDIGYLDLVETDIFIVFGRFAYETNTVNGVQSKNYYYLIPANNGDKMVYIGAKVSEKEERLYEKLIDSTYDYYYGYSDTIGESWATLTGNLKKMDDEEKEYYYQWLKEAKWFESDEERDAYALPLYIENIANPKAGMYMVLGGAAVLVIGVALIVISFARDKKEDQRGADQTHVVIGGVTYPKSTFAHVNQCINGQERAFAAQELHEITGISLEEAGNIVANWRQYYY